MPTYVVKRTTPVLASVTVEAASEDEARWYAQVAWVKDAKHAAILAEPERLPQRSDDTGDARSDTQPTAAPFVSDFRPYPKASQLARGERRYRRKVASAKQWQRIIAAKQGPCRVCRDPASNGSVHASIEFHHLVPRAQGGDDVEENIVPLCSDCHGLATLRNPLVLEVLARSLTDGEYAYIVGKLGESGIERLFRAGRS